MWLAEGLTRWEQDGGGNQEVLAEGLAACPAFALGLASSHGLAES
jgi:hypothetical protein